MPITSIVNAAIPINPIMDSTKILKKYDIFSIISHHLLTVVIIVIAICQKPYGDIQYLESKSRFLRL